MGRAKSNEVKLTIQPSLLPLGKLRFRENGHAHNNRVSSDAWTKSQCPSSSSAALLDRYPSHTPPSLETAARGAGNLARLKSQPSIQRFPTPQTGHYLPVNTASHLMGLLWKPNPQGKEGGHRGGDQPPKELTAWVPLSRDKGGAGRSQQAIPWSSAAARKPRVC